MFTTTPEQTRGFDPEVSNFLFPPVQQTRLVLVFGFVLLRLESLLLSLSQFLLLRFLRFEVGEDRREIAFVEIFDLRSVELYNTPPPSVTISFERE
jgi:hypothetical protein